MGSVARRRGIAHIVRPKMSLSAMKNQLFLMVLGRAFLAILGGSMLLPGPASGQERRDELPELAGRVLVIPVTSNEVSGGEASRGLRELMRRASRDEAEAIVLQLNTAAGYDVEAAVAILEALGELETRVIAFVKPSALGAGALLALGSDAVYISDYGVIGAAAPPLAAEEETPAYRQSISVLKARARGLARVHGHPSELAAAMIDAELSYSVSLDGAGETVLSKSGEVLALTAEEALAMTGEGPLLAKGAAESVEEVVRSEGLSGESLELSPARWNRLVDRAAMGAATTGAVDQTGEEAEDEDATPKPLFGRSEQVDYGGKILVLKVGRDDLLTKARFQFMRRVLEKAREDRPSALILDMNTPGGMAMETSQLTVRPFQDLPFPTYTFVNPHAESAGAMIAIATDHIYMYPTSTIGSALLILSTGQDPPEKLGKKLEAMTRAEVRNIAIAKGHNPDVAEAFVTTDTELVVDGVRLCEKGEVLNLNAIEATRTYEGRPLLAKGMARSIEEIIEAEGLEGGLMEVQPTGLEMFAEWVQLASIVLIAVGLAGAYTELNSPGFGVPGAISVAAFTIFFFGNYAAGNMAGYETAFVFGLGLLLVVLELLVIPGTFFVGAIGALMMVGSLAMALVERGAFTDFLEGGDFAPSLGAVFGAPMTTVSLGLILAMLLIMLMMRMLPGIRPMRWMMLEATVPQGASLAFTGEADPDRGSAWGEVLAGRQGLALTDLMSYGRAIVKFYTIAETGS